MSDKKKNSKILLEIIGLIIIIALGIAVRIPGDEAFEKADFYQEQTGSAAEYKPELLDPDSYLFARRAVEFDTAFESEGFSALKPFTYRSEDPLLLQVSSEDDTFTTNGLPIFAVILHRITGISLWKVIYFLNMVLCPLAAIPVYFFIKRRAGIESAELGALIMALSGAYVMHTMAGYFDTDGVIAVLGATSMCCMAEALTSEKTKHMAIWGGGAVLSLVLLMICWEAAYIYMLLALGAGFLAWIAKWIETKKPDLRAVVLTAVTVIVCGLTMLWAADWSFDRAFKLVLGDFNLLNTDKTASLPDASRYVSELRAPGFGEFVERVGGILCIIAVIIVIALMIWQIKSRREVMKNTLFTLVYCGSWLLVTVPIALSGLRFTQLAAIPVAIIAGFLPVCLHMFISDTKRGRLLKSVLALAIPLIFCFAVIVPAHEISSSQGKYVDEGRAEMTAWAAENLEENAQLAAWWDYNYYYQFETGLKTIGDGGLIKDEWMYWLGKAFAIDDCEKSAYLFKVLGAKGLDDRALLEEIATCETLDTKKIEKAIGSENRPTYVMLGSDMVNKAGVMGYYGLWDGSGSEPVLGVSNTSTEVDYGEEAYVDIAGIEDCKAHYERSENGAITVTIEKGEGGHYDIGRCIYMEDGNVISDATDENKAADMALTLYLMNHNNEISVVVCSPELADSTVLRLALRNGRGQNVFVPVFGNGNTIWRINI